MFSRFSWLRNLMGRFSLGRSRAKRPTVRGRFRPFFESLESRLAPATITGTTALTYTAGAGVNNNISVTISSGNFVFNDTGETITTSVTGASGSGTNTVDIPTTSVTGITLALGTGTDAISASGVVLAAQTLTITHSGLGLTINGPLTTSATAISVTNTGTGDITINGAITSANGNVSISSTNGLNLNANLNAGSGTIALLANQDSAGTDSFTQNATAATSTITTTNTTASAVTITVNTAGGGTGNANIRTIADSGTLTINANGGSILYAGTDTLNASQQGTYDDAFTTGTLAPTGTANAKTYSFTVSGSGSIGTQARPIQTSCISTSSTATLNAGSGGVYFVDWGDALTLSGATATLGGNVMVVTANAGSHNLTVSGAVKTATGNIFLAADDNLVITSTIGGAGFSGTIYLGANRDEGNAGTLTLTGATITTSNTTANAVLIEDYSVTGTAAGALTLCNITVGTGGTITATTLPTLGLYAPVATAGAADILAASASVALTAPGGTVVLTAATRSGTSAAAGIGTAALPIVVAAPNVVIDNTSTATVANDSVYVTGSGSTTFNATVAGALAGTLNLAVTSGNLTISNAATAGGGAINATTAGGNIIVSGPLGSSGSGPIALNAGAGNVTFTSTDTLLSNDPLTVTAGTAAGLLAGSSLILNGGQITSASGVEVKNGATLSGTGTVAAALNVDGTLAPTATTTGLTANSLAISPTGTLQVTLNGVNAGQFSFVTVNGPISLTNATLVIDCASSLTASQSFQIINNNPGTAITGTFVNATFTAANNPGISFTMNYAGPGNSGVLTVSQVAQVDIFDIASGTGTLAAPTGTANNMTVAIAGGNYTITDSAVAISLTGNATTAGWSNTNANTITGPASSFTTLALNTSDGTDVVNFNSANLGAANLSITGSGSVDLDGNVTTTGNITIAGNTNITDGASGTAGTLTGNTLSLTASTGIGTAAQNLLTAGTTITAAAGAGGVFITQTGTASVTATATGAGNISVTDTSGALTIAGATSTTSGAITLASAGAVNVNANVNAGSGVITISANTAGAGTAGYTQATAATLTTTNSTANAITIDINTAGGGTGSATLGNATVGGTTGGDYNANANAGAILWNNTPVARSGTSAPNVISAYGFSFTDTGTGGIGTSAVPMQITGPVENDPFSANAGSGGIYVTDFGTEDLQVNQAIATGAGNINIETSNSGGHDMLVNGTVTTGTGSITLYADDDLNLNGASAPVYDIATNGTAVNALIGGPGFSGTVDIEANLDAGNEQTLVMSAGSAIVTSNTSASAVLLASYSADGSVGSIANGGVQLTNVTVGAGGTITVIAGIGTATGRQGNITQLAGTLLDTSGGSGTTYGSVVLTARAYDTVGDGEATAVNGQGNIGVGGTVSAPTQMPIMVKAATVTATTTGTNLGNTGNINIADAVAGTFTATTSGNAVATITLATTSGALTIGGATNTGGGSLTLTGAGGVALNAALGSSATGAIAINGPLSGNGNIQMGTGGLTITQNTNSTYAGSISGAQTVAIAGTGALSLTGTSGYTGPTQINSGQLLVDSPGSIASSTTVNATGTLGGTGTAPAVTVTGGTVNPGDPITAAGTLSLSSADFSSGGDLTLNIAGFAAAGTNYDQLNLGAGALTLGGTSTLTLDLNGLASSGTATNVILCSNITGTFTNVNVVNNPNGFVPVLQYTAAGLTIVIESAATQFLVSASPSSVTAGGTTTITVTALDAYNNLAPTYSGTVYFTSSDTQAILPANATLTNGVGTFVVTLKTAGGQTVTATDTVTSAIMGTSGAIAVTPNVLDGFAVTNTPSSIGAGTAFGFTVVAEDQYGNTVTSFGGSVNLTTSDRGAFTSVPANVTLTNGVGSGNATLTTAGNQTISASNGTFSGTSSAIDVTAGAANQFVISGTPLTSVAGTPFSFTVTAEDMYGNAAPSFSGPVAFTSTDTNVQTQLPIGGSLTNGVGTFSATLTEAGNQTISVGASAGSGTSNAIGVTPAGVDHFTVTNTPASIAAGTPFSFTVTAQDIYDNTATGFAGSVHFSSSDTGGQVQLPASSPLTGGVGTFNATLATVGNQTITASSGLASGTSGAIAVVPGGVDYFVISGTPTGPLTAGTSFTFTVTADDAEGNTVTGFNGPVTFTSTDTNVQTVLPTGALTNGVGTFTATLTTAGTETITVHSGMSSGTSAGITITPSVVNHLAVTGVPASVTAGTPFSFTVTADDMYGNTVPTYGGTVAFTSSDTNSFTSLPANSTLNNGVGTFNATLTTVGNQTITATDIGNGSIKGTSTASSVTFAALNHFTVTGTPSTIVAGTPFTFTVTAFDSYGNTVGNFDGAASLSSTDTNAQTVLPGSASFTNGVSSVTATLTLAGSQTITAGVNTFAGTSAAIIITPAGLNHFALTGTPTPSITAGHSFSFTVTAEDLYGNTVPSYGGTVSFTSTDTNPLTSLPAPGPLTNGVGTFTATLDQAGSQTIFASAGLTTGTSNAIEVVASTLDHFTVSGTPATQTAGTPFTFTVTAQDFYDNTVLGYAGTVTFTSTDTNAQTSLPVPSALANGIGTFAATLTEAGSRTITASAASIAGTSSAIDVVAAGVNHFAVTGTPATQTAGTPFTFTVTAEDVYDNTVLGYAGTVSFTSTDTNAYTILPIPSTLTAGVGNFSATLTTAGSQTISASGSGAAGTSNAILITASAFDHLALTGTPASIAAGTPFTFSVFAEDFYGNTVTSYAGPISFTTTDTNPHSSLPTGTALVNGAGSFSATLDQAGGQTITASNGVQTATSSVIDVTAATLDHFAVTGTPATITAGSAFTFTVTAQDAYDNTVTGYAGTVSFMSTDTNTQTILPAADRSLMNGVGTFSATLTKAGSQTITVTDTSSSSTGTSAPITVDAASATHFAVGTPTNSVAGTPFTFTVTALDPFGNTAVSYSGTVHFTSSDSNAQTSLPSDAPLSAGAGSFSATLTAAGSQTITATDTVSSSITGTNSIAINAAIATHFVIGVPASAQAGSAFTFTVSAEDTYDNVAAGYAGTVTFTSSDTNAQTALPVPSTLTDGVGSFSATLTRAGNQTITATDSAASLTQTSSAISVHAAAASHCSTNTPASATAGNAFTLTVTALDPYGNTATTYSGTAHFTSTDTNAQTTLPTNSTFTDGVLLVSATLTKAGNQTITATDTVSSAITGTSGVISVSATSATTFDVSAPGSATAGTSFAFTVTAIDPYGNTATGYNGTVHFTTSDTNAQTSLPADSTLGSGVGTFNATLTKAGAQTISATDTVSSFSGSSGTIIVSAATATHYLVSAPADATAGAAFTFTVTAQDTYGNTATGYGGTVHFTTSDTNAQTNLPADSTLANGVGSFSATLTKAGSQTITATDSLEPSITSASNTITVSAAAATHFLVSAPNSAVAGVAFTFSVTALDPYGNTATGYGGTVHFTSSDTNAQTQLPVDSSLDDGVGSFEATLTKAGSQTISAADALDDSITGTSGAITVGAALATHYAVSAPANTAAGISFSFSVTALDAFGNTASAYSGLVHFTTSDTNAQTTLPGDSTLTNGVGSFSATLTSAGEQTITATDSISLSITGTSGAIDVSARAATHFLVQLPAAVTAGNAFTFTVTAQDQFGNTAVGYDGTVHFTSSDTNVQTSLPADGTLANGFAAFSATLTTSGTQTITATDTVFGAIIGTGTTDVSAAAATHFTVSAPASATAGVSFLISVTAFDAYGNLALGYGGTVHFTSSDTNAQTQLPADALLTDGSGSFSVTLTRAGAQTITATDSVALAVTGTSGPISVSAAAVSQFLVSAPAGVVASASFIFTVTAADPFGNLVAGYDGTVEFTSSDVQAVLPAPGVLSDGVGSFHATLKNTGAQTLTATDTAVPSLTGTSGPIIVAGTATHFTISAPAGATAGAAFTFTVTALDVLNVTATNYTGMVQFTSSDPLAILPGEVSLSDGVGTFTATLKTAGNDTLTVADTVTPSISGAATVNVAPLAATHFSINVPPSAAAGDFFTATVIAQDMYGNTATSFNDTVHFTSSDAQATLPVDSTLTGGVGSFSIVLKTVGNQTLTVNDTLNSALTGTSAAIDVHAGAASHFLVSAPASAAAGTAFTFTVTALDPFNNLASGYTGIVAFTSSDAQAVLPGQATLTAGVGSFSATLKTAGSQALTVTDALNAATTGTASNISVSAATLNHFAFSPIAAASAGTAFDFTLTAEDVYGNTVNNYRGTVHFTSSDAQAVLPANATLPNGVGTFSATFKTAGAQTLTAVDTANAATVSTSAPISVTGAVTHLVFSAVANVSAGGAFSFTVTAEDQFGNVVAADDDTIHFTSSDNQASLPADGALTGGVGHFVATLKSAGVQSLIATDTANGAISGFEDITVVAGTATHFGFTTPADASAGTSFTVMVSALDNFGNVAVGYSGTVHFATSDANPQTILPANSPLKNGVGSFNVTLTKVGMQSLSVADTAASLSASAAIAVSPGAASKFLLSGVPVGNITAGTLFTFTVTALDADDNLATGYTGAVHFSSTDTNAQTQLPADSILTDGAGTFSAVLTKAGAQTITASDLLNGAVTGTSGAIHVAAVALVSSLDVSAPADIAAGAVFPLTVTAQDPFGNPTSAYAGTIHFTSSDPQSVLPADYTFSAAQNGAQTFNATLKTLGSQTITVTDTSSGMSASQTIVVSTVATHLVLGAPADAVAGVPLSFTVTAVDAFGNTAAGYTGTVHFTSSDHAANLPLATSLVNGVGTFTAVLAKAGATTLTVAGTGLPTVSQNITVRAGAATHFLVSAPANVTAGTPFAFTLTAEDADNNTALGYSGTVQFTSSDPQSVLPTNVTLTNGIGTFHATLKTAGAQTWTAVDTVDGVAAAVNRVTVAPAAVTHYAITAPASATAGAAFSITVTAFDAYGNVATNYRGAIHLSTSAAKATLPGNYAFTAADAGAHTFTNDVTLKTAGADTLTATATAAAAVKGQASVPVNAAAATHLVVSAPTNATAGAPFNFTVTAEDVYGNTASGYAGAIHFSSTDPHAVLPANTTLINGVGTFSATLETTGRQTLTAADTVNVAIGGSSAAIVDTAGATTQFRITAPASAVAGTSVKIQITALDASGNTTTGYTGTVHFTSSDPAALLPADTRLTNGVGTFSVVFGTSGPQTIDAADALNNAIAGASNTTAVSTAAVGFAVQLSTASSTAGAALTFTVTALDAAGNIATGYTGKVRFTSSDPQATFASNSVKLTNGVGTFQATLKTAGMQTIFATDTANPSINAVSNTATVVAAAASRFILSGLPVGGTVAGTPFQFTVTAVDPYGNTATGYAGTVQFTSSDTKPQTALPAAATLSAGVGTFTATLTKAGDQTLTAVDSAKKSLTGVSSPILVTADVAASFVITVPMDAAVGVSFTIIVTALDQFGNLATSYDGAIQLTTTASQAILPATASLTAGTAVFTVSLFTAGDQTLTATDPATSITATSNEILVGGGKHS